jgi:DNA-binding transcriptional LysR family regulator
MDKDQLPHLETFARAAELSSFTAAARVLGMTQAAVSQRIQALEQSVGVSLFARQSGHVLLTDAGRRLYEFAQRILALHAEALRELTGKQAPLTGELALAASSVPGEHLLPDLLTVFRERYPHIVVRVSVSDTRAVSHQIEQGQAHLGLVGGKGDSAHLDFRSFAHDALVLVVPPANPLAQRKRIALSQFLGQPLIVREPGSASRACLEQALAAAGAPVSSLRIALELGSNEAIKEAVRRGLGLAVLSSHVVRRDVEAGQLHTLEVTGLNLTREMFAVWDRRRVLPIPARLFLDLLSAPQT